MMSIPDKLTTIAENQVAIYEAGKKTNAEAEAENLWEAFTNHGNRENYSYAFRMSDFSGYNFIKPVMPCGSTASAAYMFKLYRGAYLPGNLDLSGISLTATHADMFFESSLKEIYDIKLPAINGYHNTFYKCSALEKIEKIRVSDNSAFFQTFYGCTALKYVRFEGKICNDITFTSCSLLTVDTLLHIISRLKDFSGTSEVRTLKLGSSNLAKLTDAQQQKATDKGWILA